MELAAIAGVKSLAGEIADRLAEMIENGGLQPGERLVQMDLAERLGVSRVAIRDALHLLRERGLAVDQPRRGMVVRPLSLKDVREVFAVRRSMEGLAARLASDRLTKDDLTRMSNLIRQQQTGAEGTNLVAIDWQFHQMIFERCGNATLVELIDNLWARTRQARSLANADAVWARSWGKKSATRHRRILKALRARNPDRAAEEVVDAIRVAEEELIDGLRAAGWGAEEEETNDE